MQKKSPIAVLVVIDDCALAQRVRSVLAGASPPFAVQDNFRAPAANPGPFLVDVVVASAGHKPRLPMSVARRIARGETAVLAIRFGQPAGRPQTLTEPAPRGPIEALAGPVAHEGEHDPSSLTDGGWEPDAVLPCDAPDREILLACRLMAENARLRRRLRKTRRHRGRLAQLAESDPLTGLANRRAWHRELLARLHDSAQHGPEQCLAIVDLDFFKRVNDAQGYAVGDRLLAAAAASLRQAVRTGDLVARLGGDEFGLLLAEVERRAAAAIIGRVLARVGADPLLAAERVTASAGYVVFTAGGTVDEAALLAAADRALRQAKSQGRNRAVAACEPPGPETPTTSAA